MEGTPAADRRVTALLDQRAAALRRPAPVSRRLAGEEEVRRPDERRDRGPAREIAALPDGSPPRRVARRLLASEHVRLDRLRLPFHPELGQPLDDRARRQTANRLRPDDDLPHGRLRLKPCREVDRVADDAVLTVPAMPSDDAREHLAAVDAGAEARPVRMAARDLRRRRLQGPGGPRGYRARGRGDPRPC